MKSRSIRVALLSAFVLASALLTFAGSQPPIYRTPSKSEMQSQTGLARAVQQGKGGGSFHHQVMRRVNASRLKTAPDGAVPNATPATVHPNSGDAAFRK